MTDSHGATITRTFAAPPQLVFDAWVNPQQFAQWFGGSGVHVPDDSVSMDVRPGGTWKATVVVGDGLPDIHWVGEYIEVVPPSKLILTLSDQPEGREVVTVVLTAVDGGTQMLFTQTGGHLSAEEYARTAVGWGTFFDAMADLFASR